MLGFACRHPAIALCDEPEDVREHLMLTADEEALHACIILHIAVLQPVRQTRHCLKPERQLDA